MIATNCYAITSFAFTTLVKITVNDKKANALDICLIRTTTVLVLSAILAKCLSADFYI